MGDVSGVWSFRWGRRLGFGEGFGEICGRWIGSWGCGDIFVAYRSGWKLDFIIQVTVLATEGTKWSGSVDVRALIFLFWRYNVGLNAQSDC